MIVQYENLSKSNARFVREFENKFDEILKSGWFVLGENVSRFEKEFASFCRSKYCAGVASGFDALTLSLKAMEISPGSEIIVPSNTYIASILSIIHAGLKPVLVEPDIRTYNIDPLLIEEKLTSRTKGIMVVHLYGKPCTMDPIMKLCRKYHLRLVEDCAQSHGAKYEGKITGSFGDAGAFSFYPTKNLGALGDAGAVVTDNAAIGNKVRMLRQYGQSKKYYNDLIGINSRLDEIQAGFLSIKLKKLDNITAHKRHLAGLYFEGLNDDFIKPVREAGYFDVYHIFNIRHERRDAIRKYLLNNGITTDIHYPVPPHRQKAMKGMFGNRYPISEEIHRTTLSLPISFANTENDIIKVIEVLNKF